MLGQEVRVVGRYALYNAIAAGGMATVHLGRLIGPVGFSRTVAIKRLHAQFASDPEFVSMFVDEARLAARIRHPNVVQTLDVVATDGELFLVMDYIPGESIARLSRALRERQEPLPLRILSATVTGVLHGLHAAHEAKDERGQPLGIVHRDVSPQNVLLGADGVPRVLDFGVAKAAGRVQTTKEGQIKGKISYMPPEQLRGAAVSRQTDIYAVGVMVWELVTGQRLFSGDNEGVIVARVLEGRVERPSQVVARSRRVPLTEETMRTLETLDGTILRALSMHPEDRFATAREMALEVERTCAPATTTECADWVESIASDVIAARAAMVADIESAPMTGSDALSPSGHVMAVLGATGPHPNKRFTDQTGPSAAVQTMASPYGNTVAAAPTSRGHTPAYGHYANIDGHPVTQPSSISVATGSMNPAPEVLESESPLRTYGGGIALGLGVGAIGAFVIFKVFHVVGGPPVNTVADSPTAPTVLQPVPTPVPVPIQPPVAAVGTVFDMEADAGARPMATAAPTPTPAPTPTTAPPRTGPGRRYPPPRPANSNSADDCTYFDASGVKKYREKCLGK